MWQGQIIRNISGIIRCFLPHGYDRLWIICWAAGGEFFQRFNRFVFGKLLFKIHFCCFISAKESDFDCFRFCRDLQTDLAVLDQDIFFGASADRDA